MHGWAKDSYFPFRMRLESYLLETVLGKADGDY